MALSLPGLPSHPSRRWWPRISFAELRAAARTAVSMPLGAQQLRRQRTSTLLSLAGVTASLLVIFAQLGIERAVYESSVRLHRMVAGDLIIVPYGFKSMQLHAEVPVAVDAVEALVGSAAPIDAFGVGTRLDTASDAPTLDAVYKLESYAGRQTRKRSPGKETWPGAKQTRPPSPHSAATNGCDCD